MRLILYNNFITTSSAFCIEHIRFSITHNFYITLCGISRWLFDSISRTGYTVRRTLVEPSITDWSKRITGQLESFSAIVHTFCIVVTLLPTPANTVEGRWWFHRCLSVIHSDREGVPMGPLYMIHWNIGPTPFACKTETLGSLYSHVQSSPKVKWCMNRIFKISC